MNPATLRTLLHGPRLAKFVGDGAVVFSANSPVAISTRRASRGPAWSPQKGQCRRGPRTRKI